MLTSCQVQATRRLPTIVRDSPVTTTAKLLYKNRTTRCASTSSVRCTPALPHISSNGCNVSPARRDVRGNARSISTCPVLHFETVLAPSHDKVIHEAMGDEPPAFNNVLPERAWPGVRDRDKTTILPVNDDVGGSTASHDDNGTMESASRVSRKDTQCLRPTTAVVYEDSFAHMVAAIKNARQAGLPDTVVSITDDPTNAANQPMQRRRSRRAMQGASQDLLRRLNRKNSHPLLMARLEERSRLPIMEIGTPSRLLRLITSNDVVIVVGATGSGKTTQVPQIILDAAIRKELGGYTNVICTQPRRISATSVARRVAYERNERLQESVGYQVRFSSYPPRQHGSILYCTTGVFLRFLQSDEDGELSRFSHIVIDEVHERSIQTDFLLTNLRNIARTRKALGRRMPKIILMSATIQADVFSRYFQQPGKDTPGLKVAKMTVGGRMYDVQSHFLGDLLPQFMKHFPEHSTIGKYLRKSQGSEKVATYLQIEQKFATQARQVPTHEVGTEDRDTNEDDAERGSASDGEAFTPDILTTAAVVNVLHTTRTGDILVFLPGIGSIDKVAELLDALRKQKELQVELEDENKYRIHKLHSALVETNDDVFKPVPEGCRRIVLSTNIAETSITLPQVIHVVDSGIVREMHYHQVAGSREFGRRWISKANSMQRRGRAGRVQAGHYYALFSKERFDTFEETTTPEIVRSNLVDICLDVKGSGSMMSIENFLSGAPDPPDPLSVRAAIEQLRDMGAITTDGESITPLGKILAALPISPALTRAILLGILFRCLEPMLILASYDTEDALVYHPLQRTQSVESRQEYAKGTHSDMFSTINAFRDYRTARKARDLARLADLEETRYIRKNVYHEMCLISQQVCTILADAGLLPTVRHERDVFDALPEYLNRNSDNLALVKALALVTGSSDIAAWNVGVENGWRTKDPSKGLLDRNSINSYGKGKKFEALRKSRSRGQLLAYGSKYSVDGDKHPWLCETSMISPLTAMLFASSARLERSDLVKLNDWLPLEIEVRGDGTVLETPGKIIMEYRKSLDRFLTLAFSDLRDISTLRTTNINEDSTTVYLSLNELGKHRTMYNTMFTRESTLRDVIVANLVEVLEADHVAWERAHNEAIAIAQEKIRLREDAKAQEKAEAERETLDAAQPDTVIVGENAEETPGADNRSRPELAPRSFEFV